MAGLNRDEPVSVKNTLTGTGELTFAPLDDGSASVSAGPYLMLQVRWMHVRR